MPVNRITCYRAVCVGLYEMGEREFAARPSIHHCFIEGLEYDAEVSAFVLDSVRDRGIACCSA